MAGIAFNHDHAWMVKGYIFEHLLSIIIEHLPEDEHQIKEQLVVAIANDGLHLDLLRQEFPDLESKLLVLIENEARRIVNGNKTDDMMLKRECQRLLDMIEARWEKPAC